MKLSVGAKIWICLCGLMAVFFTVGGVSYVNTAAFQESAALRGHSQIVLNTLTDLLSALQDAETGQRGYLITGADRYLEPYTTGTQHVEPLIRKLADLTVDNPDQQRNIEALRAPIHGKLDELQQTIDLRRTQGLAPATQVVLTDRGKNLMDDIRTIAGQMQDVENGLLAARDATEASNARNTYVVIVGGALLASVFTLFAGLFLGRNISKPLSDITAAAARISTGDLSFSIVLEGRTDEVGVLSRTFRVMVDNLRQLIQEIRDGTTVLGTASNQIVSITAQVATGAAETVTALAETSSTMEEVRRTSQVSTEKAIYVSETAQKTAQVSQGGKLAVEQSIAGITRVREQIGAIAEAVMRLSEQSQAIGEIVAAVNDLAEQSNLLAVNAAIEAARAGDQGKGFVIVAQEVKSLADQSKQATAQVRAILGEIQKATATAVLAAEQGSKAVDAGVKQSKEAGEAIERLSESITIATQAATQIAASNQQQQVGIDQVAVAMENIRQASEQNMSATKQAETAARNLNDLGHKLKTMAGQYKA
jgi:methyl-accepting chemotaxis protein